MNSTASFWAFNYSEHLGKRGPGGGGVENKIALSKLYSKNTPITINTNIRHWLFICEIGSNEPQIGWIAEIRRSLPLCMSPVWLFGLPLLAKPTCSNDEISCGIRLKSEIDFGVSAIIKITLWKSLSLLTEYSGLILHYEYRHCKSFFVFSCGFQTTSVQ